jgi:uncharacterized membrane protein YdfJ with MMPL/SSD domain
MITIVANIVPAREQVLNQTCMVVQLALVVLTLVLSLTMVTWWIKDQRDIMVIETNQWQVALAI